MTRKLILALAVIIAASIAGQATSADKPGGKRQPNANNKTSATTGDDVFQANCYRCHTPPMSISPRTTGTIIMHMRTRARLSREDEVKLLRFMAP